MAAALSLTACSSDTGESEAATTPAGEENGADGTSGGDEAGTEKTIEDIAGNTVTIPADPQAIIATDNRIMRTLEEWDIPLAAAPLDLLPDDSAYVSDDSVLNLGTHNEPDFEMAVAANADLILNGQRFSQFEKELQDAAPDAAYVDMNIDVSEAPLTEALTEQITLLGEIFGHEDDAAVLLDDYEAAVERVENAYDPDESVVGLITSGGEINYSAPVTGRAIGPMYDALGLTPALGRDGSTNHQGDDISIEAIAESNPDWIIVMDRDAAVSADSSEYHAANELIAESEALANTEAVKNDHIVYLPSTFYLTEDIQAYTEFFNTLADELEAAQADN